MRWAAPEERPEPAPAPPEDPTTGRGLLPVRCLTVMLVGPIHTDQRNRTVWASFMTWMIRKSGGCGSTNCCSSWRSEDPPSRRVQQSPRTPSISLDYIFMSRREGVSWRLRKTKHGRTLRVSWASAPRPALHTHYGNTTPKTCCLTNATSTGEALTPSPSSIRWKPGPRRRVLKLPQCHHQVHRTLKIHSHPRAPVALPWTDTATAIHRMQDLNITLSGHLHNQTLPALIQVTRAKVPTSIPSSTTEAQSTINNILLVPISQPIDLCTHHMAQRVKGLHTINRQVVVREALQEPQVLTLTTGINRLAISPGLVTHLRLPPVQGHHNPQAQRVTTIAQISPEGILTLPRISNLTSPSISKDLPCMVDGLTTPSIEGSTHLRQVLNLTHSNGINLPGLERLQPIRLVLASGLNHHTNPLRIHNSLGDPTCPLQV